MKKSTAKSQAYREAVAAHTRAKNMYEKWKSAGHAPDSPVMRQLYNRMIRCQEKAQGLAQQL